MAGLWVETRFMAKWYDELSPALIQFIRDQKLFFISTAPPDGEGYPNLSPKGYDTLDVLGPRELVYADWPGSGNQTASHLGAGGRVVLMFAGLEKQAQILRVYGQGRIYAPQTEGFRDLAGRMREGVVGEYTRQLIAIDVARVQTSCGYAVPRYAYEGERDTLRRYCDRAVAGGEFDALMEESSKLQDPV